MKIIKIVSILFVLFNYSLFISCSFNFISNNNVKTQENTALYTNLSSNSKSNNKSTVTISDVLQHSNYSFNLYNYLESSS